jgi:hypothetical protein|tara:strand:+ start:307 stop:1119 length:813 start_codon:yes stop_codon:yes gene_type:complete
MAGPHQDNGVPWGGSPSQDRLRSIPDARERAIATQHTPPPPQAPPPTLQQTASTYQPGEPSAESYAGVFDPYDMDQPMATGFGSVFGASSGTTGSSETVQDALTFMMESELDKGYSPEEAALRAYGNFYNESNLMDIPSDDPFFDTNRTIADDWIGRKYTQMGQGPGGEREFWDPGYYDPRQETLDKLRFLQAGLPTRQVDQQTFFNEMVDPYAADTAEALEKGIFSGAMREGLFDPKGLRRLITSYGSGVAKPLFANVARGGIVSLVGE